MRTPGLLFFVFILFSAIRAQSSIQDGTGQKFIHHLDPAGLVIIETLEPGITLYSLSKKYNVSLDSILEVNPDLNPGAIPLGYPVHIPIYQGAISFVQNPLSTGSIAVFYRVQTKETLYRISRVYLGTVPENIIGLNPQVEHGLAIGQILAVGWYVPEKNTHSPSGGPTTTAEEATFYEEVTDFSKEYKTEGSIIREQKGLAFWRPGNLQAHYYVLHPTAKVGSYMEITNPMLHRTLTAKVAGNIPPGLYPSQVGLVVSPSVAKALGVLDQQFFAIWRFVE